MVHYFFQQHHSVCGDEMVCRREGNVLWVSVMAAGGGGAGGRRGAAAGRALGGEDQGGCRGANL